MRLFVGIPLPPIAVAHLQRVLLAISPSVGRLGWTDSQNLHITLKFLGDVGSERAAAISAALERIHAAPFQLHTDGIELFPPRRRMARIVAVRLAGAGLAALVELQRRIESACASEGFAPEQRAFHPHVNLVRLSCGLEAHCQAEIDEHSRALWPGPDFPVDQFALFESRAAGAGRQYVAVTRIRWDEPPMAAAPGG